MEFEVNPFGLLTFIVAPAILTNASSINALATSNRLARAVDRARALSHESEDLAAKPETDAAKQLRLRLLDYAKRRTLLLVRALTAFYLSIGSFAAAALISLVGAVSFVTHQDLIRNAALMVALAVGVLGVIGLVYGSALLVWESRNALRKLSEETDFWRTRE